MYEPMKNFAIVYSPPAAHDGLADPEKLRQDSGWQARIIDGKVLWAWQFILASSEQDAREIAAATLADTELRRPKEGFMPHIVAHNAYLYRSDLMWHMVDDAKWLIFTYTPTGVMLYGLADEHDSYKLVTEHADLARMLIGAFTATDFTKSRARVDKETSEAVASLYA